MQRRSFRPRLTPTETNARITRQVARHTLLMPIGFHILRGAEKREHACQKYRNATPAPAA
jgi:hypothetical protein